MREKISITDQRNSIHEEIRRILEECAGKNYIFRGEEKNFGKISSNLYRRYGLEKNPQAGSFAALDMEEDTVKSARRHFRPGTSNIEILTDLQHHGGTTTLIDFTKNIYIALFFACDENPGVNREDGRIICLDLKSLKHIDEINYNGRDDCKVETLIVPSGKNPRVIFQNSMFIHAPAGYIKRDYKTIVVKREFKNKFLDYLAKYFGITKESIYNDIYGFIKHYRPERYEEYVFETDRN